MADVSSDTALNGVVNFGPGGYFGDIGRESHITILPYLQDGEAHADLTFKHMGKPCTFTFPLKDCQVVQMDVAELKGSSFEKEWKTKKNFPWPAAKVNGKQTKWRIIRIIFQRVPMNYRVCKDEVAERVMKEGGFEAERFYDTLRSSTSFELFGVTPSGAVEKILDQICRSFSHWKGGIARNTPPTAPAPKRTLESIVNGQDAKKRKPNTETASQASGTTSTSVSSKMKSAKYYDMANASRVKMTSIANLIPGMSDENDDTVAGLMDDLVKLAKDVQMRHAMAREYAAEAREEAAGSVD